MLSAMPNRVLVIGYGNPGRLDDGLGPALAAALEADPIPGVTVDADYQLTVEDAADVTRHDWVILADAAVQGREPFAFYEVRPAPALSFSSHSVEPGALLTLATDLFAAKTRMYTIAIRGYSFDGFGEALTRGARRNLDSAIAFLRESLVEGEFRPSRPPDADRMAPAEACSLN
jgi:hydrogenase maturation protease